MRGGMRVLIREYHLCEWQLRVYVSGSLRLELSMDTERTR